MNSTQTNYFRTIRGATTSCIGLAEIRKSKGYKSAKVFAMVAGIPYSTYSAIESGRFIPSFEKQVQIAVTLGLQVEEVFYCDIHDDKPSELRISKISKNEIEEYLHAKFGNKLQAVSNRQQNIRLVK